LQNEALCDSILKGISKLSEHLLSHVDYEAAIHQRKQNFHYLHQVLGQNNKLNIDVDADSVPMFYPLLLDYKIDRQQLAMHNLFIPTLWKDVLTRGKAAYKTEINLSENLLPLPVDHRYNVADMQTICNSIKTI
jgi:hypothetical protein